MKREFDCIIVGGGHNGLTTAAYLAKAGKRVCVLERRHVLGGCSVTEELWPGYKVSAAAYVVSLLLPEVIRDLKLKQNGLKILPRTPSSFTPLLDDRYLLLGRDMRSDQQQIAKFSEEDAEVYPQYESLLERIAGVLEPLFSAPAPAALPLPPSWRNTSVTKRVTDTARLWELYNALGSLGEDLPAAMELFTTGIRPILQRWFKSEVLRATLATDAVIGGFQSLDAPGSGYVLLHHVMGSAGGARGKWGYVQGGMGGIAEAMAKTCEQLGVEIRTEAEVAEIFVKNNKVQGIGLEGGGVLQAPVVASSIDANQTFLRMLPEDVLPENFRNSIKRIDYSSASAKINLALSEPPQFRCLKNETTTGETPPHLNGTIHIGPTLDYLEAAFDDAKNGWPSTKPVLEITMPTSVDDTIAPPGKHILSMFVQYAPYRLADGRQWDNIKEDFADRCIEELARYAPNVPGAIEHRHVLSPLDLEREYRLTGGNIFQGAMSLGQLYSMRPAPGWSDHRSPVEGLYLCGAASHPGGGVTGACGRNAAQEILRDY